MRPNNRLLLSKDFERRIVGGTVGATVEAEDALVVSFDDCLVDDDDVTVEEEDDAVSDTVGRVM